MTAGSFLSKVREVGYKKEENIVAAKYIHTYIYNINYIHTHAHMCVYGVITIKH